MWRGSENVELRWSQRAEIHSSHRRNTLNHCLSSCLRLSVLIPMTSLHVKLRIQEAKEHEKEAYQELAMGARTKGIVKSL